MGEKILDGDGVRGLLQHRLALLLSHSEHLPLEFRQVLLQRIVHVHLAFVHQSIISAVAVIGLVIEAIQKRSSICIGLFAAMSA